MYGRKQQQLTLTLILHVWTIQDVVFRLKLWIYDHYICFFKQIIKACKPKSNHVNTIGYYNKAICSTAATKAQLAQAVCWKNLQQ